MQKHTTITALTVLVFTAACASPSAQHAGQSADLSLQASEQAVLAVGTGAASVAAVPLIAGGSVLVVSGAALEKVESASPEEETGALIISAAQERGVGQVQTQGITCVTPNGPPRLN
jgi:hypothetical protein